MAEPWKFVVSNDKAKARKALDTLSIPVDYDISGAGDYMITDVVRYADPAPTSTVDKTGIYQCIVDHTSGSPKDYPLRWELVQSPTSIGAAWAPRTAGKRAVGQDEIVFNVADYVIASGGTALTTDAAPAIVAAFNAMKQSGCAAGKLLIPDKSVINTPVDLDGGFSNVGNPDNWSGIGNQRLVIEARGLKINSGVGVGLTLHGFYGLVADISFRGGGSWTSGAFNAAAPTADTALEVYNLFQPDISIEAMGFAGRVLKADMYSGGAFQTSRRIRGGRVRKLNVSGCGQALFWRGVEAFGAFDFVFDNNNALGSYFGFCADTAIKHYESFNPTSQSVGLRFEGCNNFNGGVITLGDRPTDVLMEVIGNTADPAGVTQTSNFGSINRIRTTGYRPSYPTVNALTGVRFTDVSSANIDNIMTARCLVGVQMTGSNVNVKKLHSVTSDTQSLLVQGDAFNAAPIVDVGIHARFTDKQPVKIESSVTGGVVKVHGHLESTISTVQSKSGQPAIDSASTGVLDIANLTCDATGFGSITNHPGTVRGTQSARFAAGGPTKGTLWVADGNGQLSQVAPGSNGQVLGYGAAGAVAPVTPAATTVVAVNTAQVQVANTTTETALVGVTIPAGSVIAGRTYRARVGGSCAQGVNTGALTWRLRIGGTGGTSIGTAITTAQSGSAQTRNFAFEYDVTFRAASGSSVDIAVTCRYFAPGASGTVYAVTTGFNTTVDRDLVLCAAWATADSANILNVEQGTVELIK